MESRKKALEYFNLAFKANPRNPLALKYLAEYLFLRGDFKQCKEFCQAGQQILKLKTRPDKADFTAFRQEVENLKSNFCFILGKIEHVEENFQSAFEQYEQALKHNPKNYEAHMCMAKVHFHYKNY